VMKNSSMDIEDGSEVLENPCKFPRLHSELDLSQPSAKAGSSSLKRNPFSFSAGVLPRPGEGLLSEAPRKKFEMATVNGMRIPVKRGQYTHHRISVHTAAQIIRGKISLPAGHELLIWDGRFNYEYEGGHIKNARGFHYCGDTRREQVEALVKQARAENKRYVILCYCQFSSARAPKLLDILRAVERDIQLQNRQDALLMTKEPSRFTVFLVDKGYNKFYAHYPELCEPCGYVKETDRPREGGVCRTVYNATIDRARASRCLMPSPSDALRRSQSTFEARRVLRLPRLENRDNSNAMDDEFDLDSPRGPAIGKVRPFSLSDL